MGPHPGRGCTVGARSPRARRAPSGERVTLSRHRRRHERDEGGPGRSGGRGGRAGGAAGGALLAATRLGRGGSGAVVGRTSARSAASFPFAGRGRRSASAAWCPAVILLDARRTPAAPVDPAERRPCRGRGRRALRELLGPSVLARTGSAVTQQSVGPTALWLARHEPEVWRAARTIVGSYDYVAFRLTGVRVDRAELGARERPLRPRARRLGGGPLRGGRDRPGAAPRAGAPTRSSGRSRRTRRPRPGCPPGTPVVAGSADHVASAFAAGIVEDGRPARQARQRRRHPAGERRPARRRAPLPRLPPRARASSCRTAAWPPRAASSAGSSGSSRAARRSRRSTPRPTPPGRARAGSSRCRTCSARRRRSTTPPPAGAFVGPAARPRARAPVPGGARGDRVRLPPPPRRLRRARAPPGARPRHERRRAIAGSGSRSSRT